MQVFHISLFVQYKSGSLVHDGVESLGAKREYVEFLGEVVKALKTKYEASKITYIGHSAGCMTSESIAAITELVEE